MPKNKASNRPNARRGRSVPSGIRHPHTPTRELSLDDLLSLYPAPESASVHQGGVPRPLRAIVLCDYVSVFYQRAGDGFLRERDSRGRVWSRAFMRRYVELTPAVGMVASNPGVRILATREALIGADAGLHQTAFYREVMRPQGWRHGAVLCFWAEPAAAFPIFVITLYRTERQPDFSDADLARLDHLYRFLAPAVSRFHRLSVSDAIAEGIATALRHVPRGIVVLDWQLQVVHSNLAGRRSCAKWNERGPAQRRQPPTVPECLLRACGELRHQLQSTLRQQAAGANAQRRRHISQAAHTGLSASVTVVCLSTAIAEPSFVIEFYDSERPPTSAAAPASSVRAADRRGTRGGRRGGRWVDERRGRCAIGKDYSRGKILVAPGLPETARFQSGATLSPLPWIHGLPNPTRLAGKRRHPTRLMPAAARTYHRSSRRRPGGCRPMWACAVIDLRDEHERNRRNPNGRHTPATSICGLGGDAPESALPHRRGSDSLSLQIGVHTKFGVCGRRRCTTTSSGQRLESVRNPEMETLPTFGLLRGHRDVFEKKTSTRGLAVW